MLKMQVIRFKTLALAGIRQLYSASSLGMDNFVNTQASIKHQFRDLEDKFKLKMNDFASPDSSNIIFTEDLKHMIHLAEKKEDDLNLVKKMTLKFAKQNKDVRFGSFIFGPVVMRMYYHLDQPLEALEVFKALESDGFFDQLISYQILMDLLLKHDMYDEVINVFEAVKQKQLKGSKYPKNAVVLVLAACYKLNNPTSYNYAKNLWAELTEVGHYPMRRAGTFTAALAIQHNEPQVALEILTSMKQQSYVTIRNLKISALCDLGRPDDSLHLLRSALESDRPQEKKSTICVEIIQKLRNAVNKLESEEVLEEFERIESQLKNANHISQEPLSDLLNSEITTMPFEKPVDKEKNYRRRSGNYSMRPGLKDMI